VLFLCTCGIVIGVLMLNAISMYLSVYQLRFPMGYLTPIIDYGGLALSIALLLIVSVISAFIPAHQVTNEEILDAMRG